jgi:hypothetical protein
MWGKTPLPATGRIDSLSLQSSETDKRKRISSSELDITQQILCHDRQGTPLPAYTDNPPTHPPAAFRATRHRIHRFPGQLSFPGMSDISSCFPDSWLPPFDQFFTRKSLCSDSNPASQTTSAEKPRPAAKQTSRADSTITNHGRICAVPHIFF